MFSTSDLRAQTDTKFQDPNLLLARDADGASPLLLAAKLGNSSLVNVILSKVPQAIKTTDKVKTIK